jgi:transglutaminase-like putative cysteine protease
MMRFGQAMKMRWSSPRRRTPCRRWPQALERVGLAVVFVTACVAADAADTAPPWLQAQVTAPTAQYSADTSAVELYSETILTVRSSSSVQHLERRVYRILRPEGSQRAIVTVNFSPRLRITSLRGWSVSANGKPVSVDQSAAVDSALPGVLKGELTVADVQVRRILIPNATPGSLIGYEFVREEQPSILTEDWVVQDTIPVRQARFELHTPPGWRYEAHWINGAVVPPTSAGENAWAWTVTDAPALAVESQMPPLLGLAQHLVISMLPPHAEGGPLQSWHDLGVWYLGLTRDRQGATPDLRRKVAELTSTVPDPLARIQILAEFVRDQVRYVAVELGIGGYQPHAASDVLTVLYGDCKDKATLLSAMLKEIGVDSYYVLINQQRGAVTSVMPPYLGFDHVVLAIRLPAGAESTPIRAATSLAGIGRVVVFDATNPFVAFGSLSAGLQGNTGLLVTPDGGTLIDLPIMPPESNGVRRTAKLTLDAAGMLRGSVQETWSGDAAASLRNSLGALSESRDRIRPVESRLADSLSAFHVLSTSVENLGARAQPLEWNYTFEAERYGRPAGELLVVRPRVFGTRVAAPFLETDGPRHNTIELETRQDRDVFEIALPAGYRVDSLPAPVNANDGFASYQSRTELVGSTLRYTRTFEIHEPTIAASDAPKLKELYRAIYTDENAVAVLTRASQ